MQDFLNKYPRASKLIDSLTEEKAKGLYGGDIHYIEERLHACANCKNGNACGDQYLFSSIIDIGVMPVAYKEKHGWVINDCDKRKKFMARSRVEAIGLPPRFSGCSFKNYKMLTADQQKALKASKDFICELSENRNAKGLFFAGNYGVGKTHLAIAIAKTVAYKGIMGVDFKVVPTLLAETRNAIRENGKNPIETCMRSGLLILDDIGAEKVTEWVREQLYLLINHRYEHEKPTIFTTNCSLDELERRIGGAAVSRIWEMCKGVKIEAEDYRRKGRDGK